eukprot:TRINITY_DN1943_c0_g1_i1.p1 TRINITY_DN1943_c0_g1~~TRINITY_DN1943_c0_g1_i1.p1  ORF type:complete len:102 (-),score=8.04 TRINITY_DN1943_c0_g1_i1:375-680(-)
MAGMDLESFLAVRIPTLTIHYLGRWINLELYPLGSWTTEDVVAIQEAAIKKKLRKKRAKNAINTGKKPILCKRCPSGSNPRRRCWQKPSPTRTQKGKEARR